jgi:D-alanyl-D-alanine carboxypeptidase/D-alanyl-D-alanine-endopeptidase (penicillin-binding protein 4)
MLGDILRNPVTSRLGYLIRLLAVPIVCAILAAVAWSRSTAADDSFPLRERVEVAGPATPVLSARRLPGVVGFPRRVNAITGQVAPYLSQIPENSCVVVSNRRGIPVFTHQATLPLPPASGQKLITAYAALSILKPEYTFKTNLVTDSAPVGGIVNGDVWLVGGGDPVLASADYAASYRNQPQVRTVFENLGNALETTGITRIRGALNADPTRYDDLRYVESWQFAFKTGAGEQPSGPLSALNLNDGYLFFPPAGQEFGGSGPRTSTQNPPLQTAQAVVFDLRNRGVVVEGQPKVSKAPPAPIVLATVESPPLIDIVRHMLAESDNTTAELLVKEIGFVTAQQGTTAAGIASIDKFLTDSGLKSEGSLVLDGSGLDAGNRVTCLTLTRILGLAEPTSPLADGLAVAGQSGTLRDRFVGNPAAGKVRAKTGTLSGVTSLSGFVDTDRGEELVFSMILVDGDEEALKAVEEQMVAATLGWPDGPSNAELGPKTAGG